VGEGSSTEIYFRGYSLKFQASVLPRRRPVISRLDFEVKESDVPSPAWAQWGDVMARIQVWTDDWVRQLAHPKNGETVFRDPQISGHRLVALKTRKVFEVQRDRPLRFGPRKTFKVQTGDALTTTVEEARTKAIAILGQIARGLNPNPATREEVVATTLGSAWAEFKKRDDLGPKTRSLYEDTYECCLEHWQNETLANLAANPIWARDKHRAITEERGPRRANVAMALLRSIHRHAAKLDTSLSFERHACTAVSFHDEKPRQNAAIPTALMPTWSVQLQKLRAQSPLRALFQVVGLRLGTRPGELAARTWTDVDWERKVITMTESKTGLYEAPLSAQCVAELEEVREVGKVLYPKSQFIFPARGNGHLARFTEPKSILSHSGNQMRHTHHTIGVLLSIDELILDVVEGRSLLKVGATGTASTAGRGYLDKLALGPKARAAQQAISDEIDRLVHGNATIAV
jgi:integrase